MSIDFSKLGVGTSTKHIEPRKIFSTLKRAARFRRPSDEQADVLDGWYGRRQQKNITLKMNTGAGKTVVGLLCLQSCLNEGVGPAVFITPNRYLTDQVLREAEDLGIQVTTEEVDTDFLSGRAILVTNIYKIINGRSVFGVKLKKIEIGAIVVDDAHACLSTASEQFTIKLPVEEKAYKALLNLFEPDLEAQSIAGLLDIKEQDKNAGMIVPYWAWQSKLKNVYDILHSERENSHLEWQWPLIKDCLKVCTCAIGGKGLEISPKFLPIDTIPSFTTAQRRIYMTATLADDTILVSHFQAKDTEVAKPIVPKGGGDIGDRLILAPQEVNPSYSDEELKDLIFRISKERNVVVIVPSINRANNFWSDVAEQTLTKDNLQQGITKIRSGHVGLTIIVNKYDGIDLPGSACELLVIDGIPETTGTLERLEMLFVEGTRHRLVRQLQKIEQGMGRGVRSSEDHCAVLLLGAGISKCMYEARAQDLFSPATRAQVELGRSVAAQIKGKTLKDLEDVLNLCLRQDSNWVTASRNAVLEAKVTDIARIDEITVKLRDAFDKALVGQHATSAAIVQSCVNHSEERIIKGYLKQQLAEYTNFSDSASAQDIQQAAISLNPFLLRPIAGVAPKLLKAPASSQAEAARTYMTEKFVDSTSLAIHVNAILDELRWGEEYSNQFEGAMKEIALFLGFGSQRPELELGIGPDNLWALGAKEYAVIECKSGVETATINKHDSNQLNGSTVWFKNNYAEMKYTSIMVHRSITFEKAASYSPETRIMNAESMNRFKDAIRSYMTAICISGRFQDAKEVDRRLRMNKIDSASIVGLMTVRPKLK